jgi:lysophospholipase L1-like esterase
LQPWRNLSYIPDIGRSFRLVLKPIPEYAKIQRRQSPVVLSMTIKILSATLFCMLVNVVSACTHVDQEQKIEFIYLALGTSDVIGVGATPLTEGYVYLINHDLQIRKPGTFLVTLAVPGARIDALNEQVRLAKHFRGEADMATVWLGVNDLVHGDDPSRFQTELRLLLRRLQGSVSTIVVIGNLPDLTQLAVFRAAPHPAVTAERVRAFNRAIDTEAPYVNASVVNVFGEASPDDFTFDEDGFHPTKAGHQRMASLFRKTILERVESH